MALQNIDLNQYFPPEFLFENFTKMFHIFKVNQSNGPYTCRYVIWVSKLNLIISIFMMKSMREKAGGYQQIKFKRRVSLI